MKTINILWIADNLSVREHRVIALKWTVFERYLKRDGPKESRWAVEMCQSEQNKSLKVNGPLSPTLDSFRLSSVIPNYRYPWTLYFFPWLSTLTTLWPFFLDLDRLMECSKSLFDWLFVCSSFFECSELSRRGLVGFTDESRLNKPT